MNAGSMVGGGIGLILMIVVIVFLIVLAILWFCLPFAVFGTKPLLLRLIQEQTRTNQILERIVVSAESRSTNAQATDVRLSR